MQTMQEYEPGGQDDRGGKTMVARRRECAL